MEKPYIMSMLVGLFLIYSMKFLSHKYIYGLAYLYILLPNILFLLAWTKRYIGVPLSILLCIVVFVIFKRTAGYERFVLTKTSFLVIIGSLLLLGLRLLFSGMGGIMYQNRDYHFRNAFFHDLVSFDRPVLYTNLPLAHYPSGQGLLVYYVGHWLPAAVIGKIFGLQAGTVALFARSWLGLALSVFLGWIYHKKVTLRFVLLFMLFAGLDIVGRYAFQDYPKFFEGFEWRGHLEWWATAFEYPSNMSDILFVFNQIIIPRIVTLLVLLQKNKYYLLILCALAFISGPFATVGLLFIAAIRYIQILMQESNTLQAALGEIKNTMLSSAIRVGLLLFLVVGVYYKINTHHLFSGWMRGMQHDAGARFTLVGQYTAFIVLEVGIYLRLIHKKYSKDLLFVSLVVGFLLIPFYKMGKYNDRAMRVAMPLLFVLMNYCFAYLYDISMSRVRKRLLIFVLCIGAVGPCLELYRSLDNTLNHHDHIYADDIVSYATMGHNKQDYFDVYPEFIVDNPTQSALYRVLLR